MFIPDKEYNITYIQIAMIRMIASGCFYSPVKKYNIPKCVIEKRMEDFTETSAEIIKNHLKGGNMLQYSKKSIQKLAGCDVRLRQVFMFALSIGVIDISIIEGIRDQETQDKYFEEGRSKVKWPNGKHNIINPDDNSKAVDAAPFVNGMISWNKEHCILLAGIVLTCAEILKVKIRWGGNWDSDLEPITDQDFDDLVHFELIE